jgi:hypothetical protein
MNTELCEPLLDEIAPRFAASLDLAIDRVQELA